MHTSLGRISFAFLCLAWLPHCGSATEPQSRTINQRISPRWIDTEHLTYSQEHKTGITQRMVISAITGKVSMETLEEPEDVVPVLRGGPAPSSAPTADTETVISFDNQSQSVVEVFWINQRGQRKRYQVLPPGGQHRQHTFAEHAWEIVGQDGLYFGSIVAKPAPASVVIKKTFQAPTQTNPTKPFASQSRAKWVVRDRNLVRLPSQRADDGQGQPDAILATLSDKEPEKVEWFRPSESPDGSVVAVWKATPGEQSEVFTVESSPPGGGRAKLHRHPYALPGDRMDRYELNLFDTETGRPILIDAPIIEFGRPRFRWRAEHDLLIEKVDRGHQRFRLFTINPHQETVHTLIDESTDTFLWTNHGPKLSLVTYLGESNEAIYASEKSGYRHLYLVDLTGQAPMKPITQGDFLVREIVHVDQEQRTLDLVVGEYRDDQDPYHRHLIRVSIDDGKVTSITQGDGDHEFLFSPNRRFVVASYSRVDLPPVHEIRSMVSGKRIAELATAERIDDDSNASPLPVRFRAKGRDGTTDIWGVICFPPGYDAAAPRSYPVIEHIYAGPHDSHVPKQYRHGSFDSELTQLGFIVVRIDAMGTANRSKAFHDVCWQNLKDAGFPDRIAWMKSAASKYPAMDIDRVGIFGTSAGGQNACGALLFHHDFYDAAVASCGCHDNRMDKASWNEQWMGYPVGPHYAASSNIEHADLLQGDLLLMVGELDRNVPPESTLRLVDALIKADHHFEFLMLPGIGHSDGGKYGRKRMREFFVRVLMERPTEASH